MSNAVLGRVAASLHAGAMTAVNVLAGNGDGVGGGTAAAADGLRTMARTCPRRGTAH